VQTYDGLPIHHKRGLNEIQGVYFDDKFELASNLYETILLHAHAKVLPLYDR
jgi:hypothetical protein